jgi:hypothetical protein
VEQVEFKSHDKTFINVVGREKAVPVRETVKYGGK